MARFLVTGEGPVLNNRIELPALHRDARHLDVEITIAAPTSPQGTLFHAFLHDVTARRRAVRFAGAAGSEPDGHISGDRVAAIPGAELETEGNGRAGDRCEHEDAVSSAEADIGPSAGVEACGDPLRDACHQLAPAAGYDGVRVVAPALDGSIVFAGTTGDSAAHLICTRADALGDFAGSFAGASTFGVRHIGCNAGLGCGDQGNVPEHEPRGLERDPHD